MTKAYLDLLRLDDLAFRVARAEGPTPHAVDLHLLYLREFGKIAVRGYQIEVQDEQIETRRP
jgi:hypothetical protein